jgi:hypothetical protein
VNAIADMVVPLVENWARICDRVAAQNPFFKSGLHNTAPISIENGRVLIGVDPEFPAIAEALAHPDHKGALQREIRKEIGCDLQIEVSPLVNQEHPVLPTDHEVDEQIEEDEAHTLQKWYAHPVIKQVVNTFNSQITDIRN